MSAVMTASNLQYDDSGRSRLQGVDVLRGLSVLLVTLHHIHLRFWINDYDVDHVLPKPVNQVLFWSGYYAVITFFVISGFLITGLSIRRWQHLGGIQMGRFYTMRAARILPCLLALLLILSVLDLAGAPEFVIEPERASLARALWAALTFHVNWLEATTDIFRGAQAKTLGANTPIYPVWMESPSAASPHSPAHDCSSAAGHFGLRSRWAPPSRVSSWRRAMKTRTGDRLATVSM